MRALLAAALLALAFAGCAGSNTGRLSAPATVATPPSPITTVYTITIVSGDNQSGQALINSAIRPLLTAGRLLLDPLVVEVRDSHGNLAPDDKVSVLFTCVPGPFGILGVEALGQTTTGSTTWLTATPPGSGRAAVGAIPNYAGTWQVTAQVVPLVPWSPAATSNIVVFTVTGL